MSMSNSNFISNFIMNPDPESLDSGSISFLDPGPVCMWPAMPAIQQAEWQTQERLSLPDRRRFGVLQGERPHSPLGYEMIIRFGQSSQGSGSTASRGVRGQFASVR